jgi:hypothetical protein
MMKHSITLISAVFLILVIVYVTNLDDDSNVELPEVEESANPTAAQLAKLEEDLDQKEDDRIRLKQELAFAQTRLDALSAEIPDSLESIEESLPATKNEKFWSLDDVRELVFNDDDALRLCESVTELVYADFLYEIELTPEEMEHVRALLEVSYLEGLATEAFVKRDGRMTFGELEELQLEEQAILDTEMHGLLSDDDYAKWASYTENIYARKHEVNFRPQLQNFTNLLPAENLDTVVQITVEEFQAVRDVAAQENALYNPQVLAERSLQFVHAVRKRLDGLLPEDQHAQVETWLQYNEDAQRKRLASFRTQ